MRWFAEFRRPALKCERVGHRAVGEWRRGYVPGGYGYFSGVAKRVRQERSVCSRCALVIVPWTKVHSKAIHSLTASPDAWDKIEAGGWWPERGRCDRPPVALAEGQAPPPTEREGSRDTTNLQPPPTGEE